MKQNLCTIKRGLVLAIMLLTLPFLARAQMITEWLGTDNAISLTLSNRYQPGSRLHPPFTFNPSDWRLRVDIGEATITGTVTTATNINTSHIGGSAVAATNGVLTVYNLSGTEGSVTTNLLTQIRENQTNSVATIVTTNAIPVTTTNFASLLCTTYITLPDDAVAYAANQVLGSGDNVLAVPFTFTNAVNENGGCAELSQVRIVVSNATWTARMRLALFSVSGTNQITWFSNTMAFSTYYTNQAYHRFTTEKGDIPALEALGSECTSAIGKQLGYDFQAAPADRNAYFYLIASDACTPVSLQNICVQATFRNKK